jgi:hypothetical protein
VSPWLEARHAASLHKLLGWAAAWRERG